MLNIFIVHAVKKCLRIFEYRITIIIPQICPILDESMLRDKRNQKLYIARFRINLLSIIGCYHIFR